MKLKQKYITKYIKIYVDITKTKKNEYKKMII